MGYKVEVRAIAGWTHHSEHASYRAAVDQADMVHGRVLCGSGLPDFEAWQWATREQGFTGTYQDWQALDDEERQEYEDGAAGIGN